MGRRNRMTRAVIATVLLVLLTLPGVGRAAEGKIDVQAVLKAFGIGYVVDLFSSELNDFINALTLRHSAGSKEATKVVPIISAGTGAYVGAAQVTGPADRVDRVRAVGQLEGDFFGGAVRGKALVPLDSINPLDGMRRVRGVGILAVIDLKVETPVTDPVPSPPKDPPDDREPERPDGPMPFPPEYETINDGRYILVAREEIKVRGNNNHFDGSLFARDEIEVSGNRNRVTGWVEADEIEFHGNGSHSRRRSRGALDEPELDPRWFRNDARRRYDGDARLSDMNVQGVIYVGGDAIIDGDIGGRGVIAVEGDVRVRSKRMSDGVAVVSGGTIDIDRSGGRFEVALIARRGVSFDGSNNRFTGVIIADEIEVRGNKNTFAFDGRPLRRLDL